VTLEMFDQRGFDIGHRLMHRHSADCLPAFMMACTTVRLHALGGASERAHARRRDRSPASTALRDACQWGLRGSSFVLLHVPDLERRF
jgi:hypothetical protein